LRLLSLAVVALSLAACNAIHFNRFLLERRFVHDGLHNRVASLPSGQMRYFDGGEGPPVVLLHGFGFGALENWEKAAPALVKHRRVIAPDLYWFGLSVPTKTIDSAEAEAAAVIELLDALHIERADIVGASFGGLVALRLVLAYPERVDRLVLVDAAGLKPTTAERDQISANFGHSHSIAGLLMPTDLQVLKNFLEIVVYRRKPPMPDWVLKQVMRELSRNRAAKTRLCDVLEREQVDLDDLAKIHAHTLVIWGRHDPLLLESIGERMAHALPDAKLVVFEEGAHSSMLEQPARFNAVVERFLEGQSL
jgi:2-hydroxymuconate-semialdehyde hydrolase